MKRKGFLLAMAFFAILALAGCKPKTEPTISVQDDAFTLEVNEEVTITPTIGKTTESLKIVFSSDKPTIATVNNGVVKAVSVGTATIKISLEEFPNIFVEVAITVVEATPQLTLTGEDSVLVRQSITLTATDKSSPDNSVFWESTNPAILTVQDGVVTGVSEGVASVKITSLYTGDFIEKEITVIEPDPETVEISNTPSGDIGLTTNIKLYASVQPSGALQEVVWKSSNKQVATVDATGKVTPVGPGTVTITATAIGTEISGEFTFTVEPTVDEVLDLIHVKNPSITYDVMFWGNDDPTKNSRYNVFGSVNDFYFGDWEVDSTSYWLSTTAPNYTGDLIPSVEFIVIHDTASAGGGAKANAGWMVNPTNTGTSWHYTVGNDGIFQGLPHNIVGWHAGDGVRSWQLTDTKVKAVDPNFPVQVTIKNGHWVFDGIESNMDAPKINGRTPNNADLANNGIHAEVGENGNYFIGSTYVHSNGKICNTGGGENGIGIETCMNNGSDIYLTWHYTAKLVAKLMIEYDLKLDRVRQHNNFSNKDCPRTMRNGGLWPNFLKMVQAEYLVQTLLEGYTFEFKSNNLEFVNNDGRIIKLPDVVTQVSYTLKVTSPSGQTKSKLYQTVLPAKRV